MIASSLHFDSWLKLCEYVIDVAEKAVLEKLQPDISDQIIKLSDEIIDSVEECGA